jgi:hypothetical protein
MFDSKEGAMERIRRLAWQEPATGEPLDEVLAYVEKIVCMDNVNQDLGTMRYEGMVDEARALLRALRPESPVLAKQVAPQKGVIPPSWRTP